MFRGKGPVKRLLRWAANKRVKARMNEPLKQLSRFKETDPDYELVKRYNKIFKTWRRDFRRWVQRYKPKRGERAQALKALEEEIAAFRQSRVLRKPLARASERRFALREAVQRVRARGLTGGLRRMSANWRTLLRLRRRKRNGSIVRTFDRAQKAEGF